jgi:hypothetical protein
MTNTIVNVTKTEFEIILKDNNYFLKGLEHYEIIPDFELTGNKIIDKCLHVRKKNNESTLYFGGSTTGDCYEFQCWVNKNYKCNTVFVDNYRAVLADKDSFNIYTYCEGDITVEVLDNLEAYQKGIEVTREFYKNN